MTADSTTPQPNGQECPPYPEHPAPLPHPPADPDDCKDPTTWPKPPEVKPPKKCDSDLDCTCPKPPGPDAPECLEKLISDQSTEISKGDKAKAFKADLEAFLAKAKTANQDYTPDKYKRLIKQWGDEDTAIAGLVRGLACYVPCWYCVIECYICPLFNDLRFAEQSVYGDGTHCADAHDLQDLLYWHTRDKDAKERTFNRIKNVLAAWEKPATTIEKALADNQTLIDAAGKVLGTEPGKAIYDVFLRLIPMHLAIAPPAGAIDPSTNKEVRTRIDVKYTEFCKCALPTPPKDDCCGPNLGELTLLQRLIGPQPYLISPGDYFTMICCLVKRYSATKTLLAEAEANVARYDNDVKKYKGQLDGFLKSFEKDAKARIPAVIDCCDYKSSKPKDQTGTPGQTSR